MLVVDGEIYRCLPALLISTVDKFAQMPWNGATQMLFGKVDKQCSRHGFHCPDLEDKDHHWAVGSFPAARSIAHAPLRPPDLNFITAFDDLSRRVAYVTGSAEVGATVRTTLGELRDYWLEMTRTNVGTCSGSILAG